MGESRKLKQDPIEEEQPTAFTPDLQQFVLQDVVTQQWEQPLFTAIQNNDDNEFGNTISQAS
jgi:hypothetical protein